MRVAYLDTSAAAKLVLDEPESPALFDYLADDDIVLISGWLLFTEMLCAVGRRPELIDDDVARQAIDQLEFVDISRHDLIAAARFSPLRSNDAIHLAVALRMQADEMITYDRELIDAAPRFGVAAVSPGAPPAR